MAGVLKKRRLNGDVPSMKNGVSKPNRQIIEASKVSKVTKPTKRKPEPAVDPLSEDAESDHVVSNTSESSNGNHAQPLAESASGEDESEEMASEDDSAQEPGDTKATDGHVPKKTFADLGVIESLVEATESLGYKYPTPIQEQAVPIALQGRDVIGLAETGSGKTAAFVLPMLQALMEKPQPYFGLVLAPTRELAYQISQQVEALGSVIGVRCAVLVGGMDMMPQAIALGKKPHVIVASPGRLMDHLENTKGFSLKALKYLVLDEADRLLDMDFGPVLDRILKVLPREGRHTSLFSATMSSKVESLQRASLQNPIRVSISSSDHQTVKNLVQRYIFIPHKHKDIYLMTLLNEHLGQSCIIFARTVNEVQRIAILCRTLGFAAIPLHGQLSQSMRLGALNKFKSKSRDILVATDVAARGLDIPSVDLVINYDLAGDSKTYVHRVGRTARAGKSGKAISFVTQYDLELWMRTENALGKKVEEESIPKEEAMMLAERVGEAQIVAVREMRTLHDNRGKKGALLKGKRGGGKRRRDEMDREEG